MALDKYNKKRNFKETSEPAGKTKRSGSKLIFVVQKHDASHLHYDFRLELNGVLLSWAVPKGPSLNPNDKRLAILVEDHPYDYKDFEGTIPKGNYGAGTVIVWDNGTYVPSDKVHEETVQQTLQKQFEKGQLSFILKGKKLKGHFSLVKLKSKEDNAWLLMKKDDQYASEVDVLLKDKSVLSKKTLSQMEKSVEENLQPNIEKHAKNAAVEFQKPMLATLTAKAFDDPNWIFENKYDGYRCVAVIKNSAAELYSRNHNSFTKDFKSIATALEKLSHEVVLDGEVVLEDKIGVANFQLLQNYLKDQKGDLNYYVFDILNLDGNDTTHLSLLQRKELLELLFAKHQFKHIHLSPFVEKNGIARLKQAEKQNSD